MGLKRLVVLAGLAAFVGVGAYQIQVEGQAGTVTISVLSATSEQVSFRGAVMFEEGGLQILDAETPFEIDGEGGVAVGLFERTGAGPDIRVTASDGRGPASGVGARVIVGHEVTRSIQNFAWTAPPGSH